MANAIATAYVQVIPSTDGIQGALTKEFDQAGSKAGASFGGSFGNFMKGTVIAGAVVAAGMAVKAMGDIAVESVKLASDLNETSAAIDQVFGNASESLKNMAKEAPKSLGQTSQQFLNAAKTFGIFGKAAGLAEKDNAAFSAQLVRLATDLASFNNTDVDTAINAIGAGLRGESEPLRQFGVLLDDATLKARAMSMGIYDGTGQLTQQQRVLAAQAEILAQTSTQQGDFARTSDGLANSQRTLAATIEETKTKLGEALLPAVEAVLPQITALLDNMVADPEFNTFIQELGKSFSDGVPAVVDIVTNFSRLGYELLPLLNPLMETLGSLTSIAANALDDVSTKGSGAYQQLKDIALIIETIDDILKDWDKSWDDIIKNMGETGPVVRGIVDSIFGSLNPLAQMVEKIANLIRWINGQKAIAMPGPGSGVIGLRSIPGLASGGTVTSSGLTLVGENGPEILNLGRGSQVIPLDKASGQTVIYNAAPNNSIDSEQSLFLAMQRAKVVTGW